MRDCLVAKDLLAPESIGLYAAASPAFCPVCYRNDQLVYSLRSLTRADVDEDGPPKGFRCIHGHQFTEASYHDAWASTLNDTQHRFKHNQFPLLVTTKAYGMGIDHRGLRFVVHYGMPSSLESYYQEIGRAGRDDKQAHCALLVRLPHEKCLDYFRKSFTDKSFEDAEDSEILPPCLSGPARTTRRCPPEIGLPEPCDISRQLMMMLSSYVKPERFSEQCAEVWQSIMQEAQVDDGSVTHFVSGAGLGGDRRLMAHHSYLYRLQQLGLVRRFRVEYVPSRREREKFNVRFHVWLEPDRSADAVIRKLALRVCDLRRVSDAATPINQSDLAQVLQNEAPTQSANDVAFVKWAVKRLFAAVRGHVIKMRIESFGKLLQYAQSEKSCRRGVLLGGMTGEVTSDHACKFCDSDDCVPNLHFASERAEAANDSAQYRDMAATVAATIDREDIDSVAEVRREAVRRNCLGSLGHLATTHLTSYPDNLAAHFIAAESYCANPDEKLRQYADRYYRAYARISNVERRDHRKAKVGYDAYRQRDMAAAIKCYAISGSSFDDHTHLHMLAQDSSQASLDKSEVDNIQFASVQAHLHDVIASLKLATGTLDEVFT